MEKIVIWVILLCSSVFVISSFIKMGFLVKESIIEWRAVCVYNCYHKKSKSIKCRICRLMCGEGENDDYSAT